MPNADCEGVSFSRPGLTSVNSWALYLYLIEQGEVPGVDFEAVAVNHHTDWPETYEYMQMMIDKGYPVTVIEPDVGRINSLYDYCLKFPIMPDRRIRWCTQKFKVEILKAYYKTPCIELVGFDAGEIKRRTGLAGKVGVEQDFPLIEAGIDRQGCADLIKRHGLPVPIRSGCYICPFQTVGQWRALRQTHPELFCKAQKLEQAISERRAAKGKSPVYFRDKPLDLVVQETQVRMWDDRPPCRCGL